MPGCSGASRPVAPAATLLAAETLVFGRAARGEVFAHGALRESWRIRRDGAMVWADGSAFDPPAALQNPFGFAGAEALATLLFCGEQAGAMQELLRGAGAQVTLPARAFRIGLW